MRVTFKTLGKNRRHLVHVEKMIAKNEKGIGGALQRGHRGEQP
jgi:hypothetical protein